MLGVIMASKDQGWLVNLRLTVVIFAVCCVLLSSLFQLYDL